MRRAALVSIALALPLLAQLAIRPDDPSGLSIRVPRVQILHASSPGVPGTSMDLQQRDPWLAYALGRDYFQREWTADDAVFARRGASAVAGAANSCALCHNLPFRAPGYGGNTPDPAGFGRNAPHLFGIGLLETLAIQIRAEIVSRFDVNRNGFLDHPAETRGHRAIVDAGGVDVDFGALDDANGDGFPDLNGVLRPMMVDAAGRVVEPDGELTADLRDPRVAGYDFYAGFLGASFSDHQLPTVRLFTIGVMETLMGIPSVDPTVANGRGNGWSQTSIAGAPQLAFPVALEAADCARPHFVSEGELDVIEWYLMNHPPPAARATPAVARRGRDRMRQFGCTACHVADWRIAKRDDARGFPGDRRFFRLDVQWRAQGFEARVVPLANASCDADGAQHFVPRRDAFTVSDVFTDLRHHDVGSRFHEYQIERGRLVVTKSFRTPALWGVGSTAPYGHDGRSPTLDDVIRRHDGDAGDAAYAYRHAPERERRELLSFLQSLVLYSPDLLPADLDGDGRIAASFRRDGRDLGPERFQPELLFAAAPRYRGWTKSPEGEPYFSFALENVQESWARDAVALADRDRNGVPDLVKCSPVIDQQGGRHEETTGSRSMSGIRGGGMVRDAGRRGLERDRAHESAGQRAASEESRRRDEER